LLGWQAVLHAHREFAWSQLSRQNRFDRPA
jgi:hypothetical protein